MKNTIAYAIVIEGNIHFKKKNNNLYNTDILSHKLDKRMYERAIIQKKHSSKKYIIN